MTPNRKDSKVTRLDLRIPNDIYSQVEEIAHANNEPSHHITGNIILSPTLLKLISLGIRSLSGNYSELTDIPANISQVPDTLSPRVCAIERELTELKKLITELSDRIAGIIPDNTKTLSALKPDIQSDSSKILADIISDNVSDINSIAIPTPKAKTFRDNEPEWVTTDNRRFYTKLVNDSELLGKVAEVIPQYPKDNSALATALVEVGLAKGDGTAFDSASISRIKKVVEHLNTQAL
jgi:hypothetical protein